MATLQEIRQRLQSQQNKQNFATSDAAIFAFWNMKMGETATVRFLPDGNDSNTFFWVERKMINLPFSGTTEDPHTARVITIPCVEMWGDKCPILEDVRPMFKDASLQDTARKYWPKKSYIFQGLVVESPLEEKDVTSPIRRFIMNPQIFKVVQDFCMDPDAEFIPTDYQNGRDFRIKKTQQGQWSNYSTSSFAMKERALSDAERQALKEHELYDLSSFLPTRPTPEDLLDFKAMFEASLNQEVLDVVRFSKWIRGAKPTQQTESPKEVTGETLGITTELAAAARADTSEEPLDFFEGTEEKSTKPKRSKQAQDVLEQLAARSKAKKA